MAEEVDQEAMMAAWEAELAAEAEAASGGSGGGGGGDGDAGGDLAAEWEAMVGGGGMGERFNVPSGAERILNQDEIDSLLGFDLSEDDYNERSGIRAIINSAMVSYERLPMLEIVFDRLVRLMTTSLRNFTSDNVEVSLDNISSIRFGDYLNSIPLPAILAVFRAEELDNYGLLTVDSNLIYSIVDVLLGGRRGTAALRIEGRPYTTIERVLVQRMVEVILNDAKAAFEPLTPVNFNLDRLETNPRFAAIARPANAAILVKLRIDMEDRGGRVELLLPYATLEPIRKMLLQQFMGEKFGRDNIWESHLATEIWTTQMEVRAVLDEQQMPLSKVLNLEVGETLILNANAESPVQIKCGAIPLTTGRMGRKGHSIAVRVDSPLASAAKRRLMQVKK
ncbi:flagellar motor switch protein FliM [Asticcacaulis taihuensis]|jgi:flagellar motor switch protein FliM|uniref:Flagellar motor switch protein FliM n=2 Tax=Caulobacteraceae TaxID=76892 RepID=A0A1G4QPC3_9CAUL|nr:flagellar motor switch protein FliM [Asticcacaulis taihuensis]SCW45899.1 flagellar motor switch protein FliM [Asticcacaulis taihuensis]